MTDMFASHAADSGGPLVAYRLSDQAAFDLIQAQLEIAFVEDVDGACEAAEDQVVLERAFIATVDAWTSRRQRTGRGAIDHRQVIRAHFSAAYKHLQGLEDIEWEAIADDIPDEIAALRDLCDPDDSLLNDQSESPD